MRGFFGWLIAAAILLYSAPAFANGRDDYIPNLDPALRRHIQVVLKREGFYRGSINGTFGTTSRAALRRFRVARGIGNERIDHGGGMVEDLTLYLTPSLIRALFGIEMGSGTEELSACQFLELWRRLGITPARPPANDYLAPDDEGYVRCPGTGGASPQTEG